VITILQDDDFENFVNGLVNRIDGTLNLLETWMEMWLHLPLRLPWKYILSLKELCYAKQLKLDLENQK
ncbi:1489_t:CDS:2, partial [Rhizophagus irregularis]